VRPVTAKNGSLLAGKAAANSALYIGAARGYGVAQNAEEFCFKVQAANYEGPRAMYSAFGANKPAATGIVQWMLNSARPKIFWQLYDSCLMPGGVLCGAHGFTAAQPGL
jgi:hypothetical protein